MNHSACLDCDFNVEQFCAVRHFSCSDQEEREEIKKNSAILIPLLFCILIDCR